MEVIRKRHYSLLLAMKIQFNFSIERNSPHRYLIDEVYKFAIWICEIYLIDE